VLVLLDVGQVDLLAALHERRRPLVPSASSSTHLRRSREFVLKTVVAAGVLSPAEAEEGKREVLTAGGKTRDVSHDIPQTSSRSGSRGSVRARTHRWRQKISEPPWVAKMSARQRIRPASHRMTF